MQMKTLTALFVAGAFALGAGFASAAPAKSAAKPAEAKKDDKAAAKDPNQFDDWRLQCQKPQGATAEVCELTQFAIMMPQGQGQQQPQGEAKGQLLLTVGILKPNAAEPPRMILRAPLGVFLQPSPVIKVPGHKDVQVPFMRCDQTGCFSFPLSLAPEFVDAAKATDAAVTKDAKATNGTVTVAFQVNKPGESGQLTNVTLPLSMKGIGKGLEALGKKAPIVPAAAAPAPAKKDGDKKK